MPEIKKKRLKIIIITFVILIIFCSIGKGVSGRHSWGREDAEKEAVFLPIFKEAIFRQMERTCFMLPAFLREGGTPADGSGIWQKLLEQELPLYGFLQEQLPEEKSEDEILAELIKKQEGADEDIKNIEESHLDYGKDALHIENSVLEEMQKENDKYIKEAELAAENPRTDMGQMEFQAALYPAYSYDWSEQWGYEELVSNFFAVDNTTFLKEEYVNLDDLLFKDLSVNREADGPQILIYHTHSQEGFADSIPGDASTTIVGAGEKLAELLREKYGFQVLHHTGEYDVENRDYAYNNTLPVIQQILDENPAIEAVIDLHRDAIAENNRLVIDLQGRPTARFMFFDGMSYIRNKGDISYLENPYIQENLAFAFQAQVAANEYYPGIARKIYLKAYRYNLHLKPKSMLIELGAQNNTVEEIMNACEPLAHVISIVLG